MTEVLHITAPNNEVYCDPHLDDFKWTLAEKSFKKQMDAHWWGDYTFCGTCVAFTLLANVGE